MKAGNTLFNIGLNLILSYLWLIPAVIALVLHFLFGLPLIVTGAFVLLWLIVGVSKALVLGAVSNMSPGTPPKEQPNVNPYSPKNEDLNIKR